VEFATGIGARVLKVIVKGMEKQILPLFIIYWAWSIGVEDTVSLVVVCATQAERDQAANASVLGRLVALSLR
jgi:hypothetical protein